VSAFLPGNFFRAAYGLTIADGGGVTWSFDKTTNTLSVSGVSGTGLAADSVSNTELTNMAQATVKGRAAAAGTGDPQDLTASQVKTILALTSTDLSDFTEAAQDAVLNAGTDSTTIDFTYNDGANTWTVTVIDDSISDAKLRNSGALSVIGRAANSSGDPADISSSSNDTLLRRTASTLNWGQLTAGMFPNTVVPDAALSSNVPLLNAGNTFSNATQMIAAVGPVRFRINVTDSAADQKVYEWVADSAGNFYGLIRNDALGVSTTWLQLVRSTTTATSLTLTATDVVVTGKFKATGNVGFNNTTPIAKPAVTGSRGGNAALASLLTALANYGLITDSTTA
jgi:hypothetical protein